MHVSIWIEPRLFFLCFRVAVVMAAATLLAAIV